MQRDPAADIPLSVEYEPVHALCRTVVDYFYDVWYDSRTPPLSYDFQRPLDHARLGVCSPYLDGNVHIVMAMALARMSPEETEAVAQAAAAGEWAAWLDNPSCADEPEPVEPPPQTDWDMSSRERVVFFKDVVL